MMITIKSALVGASLIGVVWWKICTPVTPNVLATGTITVQQGQTLWAIARQCDPREKYDPRDVITWIETQNHLSSDGTIQAGEELKIPVLHQ